MAHGKKRFAMATTVRHLDRLTNPRGSVIAWSLNRFPWSYRPTEGRRSESQTCLRRSLRDSRKGNAAMDAIEVLKTRRSVRTYKGEPVPRKIIEDIVDCGRLAATANNMQPWEFVVVTDPGMLPRIATTTDFGKFIADAPSVRGRPLPGHEVLPRRWQRRHGEYPLGCPRPRIGVLLGRRG